MDRALPAIEVSAAPASWVPVAYGDAQVSVPPGWAVLKHGWCGGQWPPIVQIGPVVHDLGCPSAPPPPTVQVTPLASIPPPYRQERPTKLNGIAVYKGPGTLTSVTYFVPSLHVELSASRAPGVGVIDTLKASPRPVALAAGAAAVVPLGWKELSFGGVSFATPASWPVDNSSYVEGAGCSPNWQVVMAGSTRVTLSSDTTDPVFHCPEILISLNAPLAPADGLRVDLQWKTDRAPEPVFSNKCLLLHGLTACPASSYPYSLLLLRLRGPGLDAPVFVSIGLGGDGTIARTIVHSLRPAQSGPAPRALS